jgi:predicted SprT family Zn-dependent metalloprotease
MTTASSTIHALEAMARECLLALQAGRVPGLPPLPDLPDVRVRVSARLTRSAGIYRRDGEIVISSHFLAAHGLERTRGILRHEIAHHVVRFLHGRAAAPHGREFRVAAHALSADLHAPAFPAPRTRFVYRCPRCGWEWRRGRRLPRGWNYSCARCAPAYDERFRLRLAGRWRAVDSCRAVGTPL